VLAGPRQLLNCVRPNLPLAEPKFDNVEPSLTRGVDGPFVKDSLRISQALEKACTTTLASPRLNTVGPVKEGYNYCALFYSKITNLAKSAQIPLILVYFPEYREFGTDDIRINIPITSVMLASQKVIALSSNQLFGAATRLRVKNFYRDDLHLNKKRRSTV